MSATLYRGSPTVPSDSVIVTSSGSRPSARHSAVIRSRMVVATPVPTFSVRPRYWAQALHDRRGGVVHVQQVAGAVQRAADLDLVPREQLGEHDVGDAPVQPRGVPGAVGGE